MIIGAIYAEDRCFQDSFDRAMGKETPRFTVLGYDDILRRYWVQYEGEQKPCGLCFDSPIVDHARLVAAPEGVEPISAHVKFGHVYNPDDYY